MAFRYVKSRNANQGRVLRKKTITDSQVLSVGEAVKLVSGKVSTWGAGGAGYGIVVGFVKADGSPVTTDGAGNAFSGTYTAGSSNTVCAMVDVSKGSIYSVALDDTIGTTTGSNLEGYNADLTAGSQTLDESSTVSTTASFFLMGADPDPKAPSNSVLCSIQESQVDL